MAIWGSAIPVPIPVAYATVGGADVAVPSSTETTVITTGALVALNPGPYFPQIWATLAILMGATAPTALVVAFKLGAGSDVDSVTVAPALLVNSGTLNFSALLIGANSNSAWVGAGSTINITVNATGQAVTAKFVGSRAIVGLFRGPDI